MQVTRNTYNASHPQYIQCKSPGICTMQVTLNTYNASHPEYIQCKSPAIHTMQVIRTVCIRWTERLWSLFTSAVRQFKVGHILTSKCSTVLTKNQLNDKRNTLNRQSAQEPTVAFFYLYIVSSTCKKVHS